MSRHLSWAEEDDGRPQPKEWLCEDGDGGLGHK